MLYARLLTLEGREGWSHEAIPDLLKSLPQKILRPQTQRDLTERLQALYELRLSADFRGDAQLNGSVTAAVRSAAFVLKIVNDILPGE